MNDINAIKSNNDIADVVAQYVSLTKRGNEFTAICPFHEENTPSFSVIPSKQKYHCFGCGAHGDAIDFVEKIEKINTREAIKKLSNGQRGEVAVKKAPSKKVDVYSVFHPLACDQYVEVGEKISVYNPKSGKAWIVDPVMVHAYGDQGWKIRAEGIEGKKIYLTARWCKGPEIKNDEGRVVFNGLGWVSMPFDEPKPIYNLSDKKQQRIIVEGEKAADAGHRIASHRANFISWDGASSGALKTDWSPILEDSIILIPDNDDGGKKAMRGLAEHLTLKGARNIKIVNTDEMPEKWDIADKDWGSDQELIDFCKNNLEQKQKESTAQIVDIKKPDKEYKIDWRADLMFKDDGVKLQACVHNAIVMISNHPELKGVFAYNAFASTVDIVKKTPWDQGECIPRSFEDTDSTQATAWLEVKGCKLNIKTVHSAIVAASRRNKYDPLSEYITGLVWDQKPRIEKFLIDFLGCEDTHYTRAVSKRFLIGAIARAMDAGCKMDTMLILEGDQGIKKSTAVAELFGSNFTTDELSDLGSKDASLQVQGVWAVEIAEMTTMNRSESSRIKEWLSRRSDRFRPPYGANLITAQRRCVLVGTVNPEGGYLKDPTGARRFWPVLCKKVDIDGIRANRDQIWAEALYMYLGGERWWLDDSETLKAEDEQAERYDTDAWDQEVVRFLSSRDQTSISSILTDCLDIPIGQQNQGHKIRVSKILTAQKWLKKRQRFSGALQWLYFRP